MGNQEAKQKRAAAASSNGSYPSLAEGWKEGGGDIAKKGGKKLHGKHGCKGAVSDGGGGSHGTGLGKKKSKSDSKSSVFSLRKRKGNLKGKGDACLSVTGSKEDVLSVQNDELDSTKTPDLSADEFGQSDTEAAFPNKIQKMQLGNRNEDGGRRQKQGFQQKASTIATSPTEEGGQKGGSSGSDTDIYSFHSAADHEDLLADIQLAIKLQHQQNCGVVSVLEAHGVGGGDLNLGGAAEARTNLSNGIKKLTPPEVLDLTPELEVGSDALSFLERGALPDSAKPTDLPLVSPSTQTPLSFPSFHTEVQRHGETKEEGGQSEKVREVSLCIATDTKDQHALLQHAPLTEISMATAGGVAVCPVTMETCGNSFPEVTFDSAETSQGKLTKAGGGETLKAKDDNLSPTAAACMCKSLEPAGVLGSGVVLEEGECQLGSHTSAESLNDCLSAGSESNGSAVVCTRAPPSDQQSRRGSACFTPPPVLQESPTSAKHLRRSTHSSSAFNHAVKPYPPIFPSYIKTTTRQLSSPGHLPGLSPSHSPLSPRRAQQHLFYRYACCRSMMTVYSPSCSSLRTQQQLIII